MVIYTYLWLKFPVSKAKYKLKSVSTHYLRKTSREQNSVFNQFGWKQERIHHTTNGEVNNRLNHRVISTVVLVIFATSCHQYKFLNFLWFIWQNFKLCNVQICKYLYKFFLLFLSCIYMYMNFHFVTILCFENRLESLSLLRAVVTETLPTNL